MSTIFTKIINKEIPSAILYEDEFSIAILDIAPVNKGHALVIAKEEIATTETCSNELLAHLMSVVKRIDIQMRENLKVDATNIIINNGKAAGQEVPHLHIHIIPRYVKDGKAVIMNKSEYKEGEMDHYKSALTLQE